MRRAHPSPSIYTSTAAGTACWVTPLLARCPLIFPPCSPLAFYNKRQYQFGEFLSRGVSLFPRDLPRPRVRDCRASTCLRVFCPFVACVLGLGSHGQRQVTFWRSAVSGPRKRRRTISLVFRVGRVNGTDRRSSSMMTRLVHRLCLFFFKWKSCLPSLRRSVFSVFFSCSQFGPCCVPSLRCLSYPCSSSLFLSPRRECVVVPPLRLPATSMGAGLATASVVRRTPWVILLQTRPTELSAWPPIYVCYSGICDGVLTRTPQLPHFRRHAQPLPQPVPFTRHLRRRLRPSRPFAALLRLALQRALPLSLLRPSF